MINYIRPLLIASLIITSTYASATQPSQVKNKQFIFGPVRVSPALARLSAVSTIYGGWKACDCLDAPWISNARESVSDCLGTGVVRIGTAVAKAALLTLIAERLYDYVHTAANYATWPAYAARLLQLQVNELIVVQSLYNDAIERALIQEGQEQNALIQSWQQLLKNYHEQCDKHLTALTDIGFYVGDEITVQLLEALRHDLDNFRKITLDRYEIMNFVRHDELLYMRLQALYAAADHVRHTKENLRSSDLHACHHEIQLVHDMFNTLSESRMTALAEAVHHCNRIASVAMSKDVISGAVQYAQWRITNFLQSQA
jgi:hypothetical protein